ncbi:MULTISPECIES: C45 family autoproteolytic acyltransferase/hydolase [Streptomyces]|uniref:Peptidase C45 n=1 Tax=Streptomyces tsukubensis (strain DSM 42081 / NBRC 108919 / NRRL 18488 / 9993) TaxID=1114943 RepID=I2MZ97_STRT9|nr:MULTISPECIES: C45 family peptidase [Streptomyces]AZK94373.1 peptidase C45 [Streptomyces tsukubensis]EIF90094.1 peptidase C45 acyl-coenzyme A:6-aminopenicillanic acid acyl-transferase [Streptomyces tsukubensis NRRL18488]MYS64515.1 peptidase C45 [Streptomyces sp. SID5473]QKM69532.1 peptidase C45 [Streptomyces tsukubensis NRRL18488]TAI42539.1 peptidase C45 [Streptomyces tsukubensis]
MHRHGQHDTYRTGRAGGPDGGDVPGDGAGAPAALLRLAGDPFELGRQHGAARAAGLRAFLDDGLARINHLLDTPVTTAGLGPLITDFRREIETAVPELAEEIRGLAAGAGISHEQALLLQLRREITGYRDIRRPGGDCTTYARVDPNGPHTVLAQTVDLSGDLDDQSRLLSIDRAGGSRRVLVLSFGGLLGYLGMNSDGLAVGINLVLGGRWRPGLPPYLAVRHVLDSAGSVDEALGVLEGLKLASSRSLTLCDPRGAACTEFLDGRMHTVRALRTVHTNHFLHREFIPYDKLNVFARNSSLRRLEACSLRLDALPEAALPGDHLALLSAPPVFVPGNGNIRRERTVAMVAMRPAFGDLHLLGSRPSETPRVFSARALTGTAGS